MSMYTLLDVGRLKLMSKGVPFLTSHQTLLRAPCSVRPHPRRVAQNPAQSSLYKRLYSPPPAWGSCIWHYSDRHRADGRRPAWDGGRGFHTGSQRGPCFWTLKPWSHEAL